jgi:hypothetical protein
MPSQYTIGLDSRNCGVTRPRIPRNWAARDQFEPPLRRCEPSMAYVSISSRGAVCIVAVKVAVPRPPIEIFDGAPPAVLLLSKGAHLDSSILMLPSPSFLVLGQK